MKQAGIYVNDVFCGVLTEDEEGFHFSYDDGTPYYCIGTTCYVWELRNDELITETLKSLKKAGFNKIRFCIFPKHYVYNLDEPRSYPFEGKPVENDPITPENFMEYDHKTAGNKWDFERFNPEKTSDKF